MKLLESSAGIRNFKDSERGLICCAGSVARRTAPSLSLCPHSASALSHAAALVPSIGSRLVDTSPSPHRSPCAVPQCSLVPTLQAAACGRAAPQHPPSPVLQHLRRAAAPALVRAAAPTPRVLACARTAGAAHLPLPLATVASLATGIHIAHCNPQCRWS